MARTLLTVAGMLLASVSVAFLALGPPTHAKNSADTAKKDLKAGKALVLHVCKPCEGNACRLNVSSPTVQSRLRTESSRAYIIKALPNDKTTSAQCRSGACTTASCVKLN